MKNFEFSFQSCPLCFIVVLLLSMPKWVLTQSDSSEEIECQTLPPPPNMSVSTSLATNPTTDIKHEDKQQEILSRGMDQLHFDKYDKKAIFMLGNTGSGKTTITQTLNGNLSQLHAVRTQSGQMVIIDDQNRIGLPTTKSKTLVPEYVRNPETNVSFYDCPGFDDNRGAEADIAAMYFVNSITEHVEQAKFLFVVKHSSLIMGHDRLDFDLLATHASQFLLNMTKFSDSIGLIVNKVNSYSPEGKYITDKKIIRGVVGFLSEFHSTIRENLEGAEHKDVELLQRKIQFVEALLTQDSNKNYSKIWFVRSPTQCGSFSNTAYYTEVRRKITNLYANKLIYSLTVSTDFGITLKDKTLLKVKSEYVPQLLEKWNNITQETIDELIANYQEEFEGDFNTENRLRASLLKLNKVYHSLSTMTAESYSFSEGIENVFRTMEYVLPETYVNETRKIEDLLRFYEKVTTATIARPSISPFILKVKAKIRDLREKTFNFIKNTAIPNILSNMTSSTDQALNDVMKSFQSEFETNFNDENGRKDALIRLTNVTTNLQNFPLNSNQSDFEFTQEITKLSGTMGYSLPPSFINEALKFVSLLQFYENVTLSPIKYPSLTPFLTSIQNQARDIKDRANLKIINIYVPQLLVEFNNKTGRTTDELFVNYKHEFDGDFNTENRLRESLLKLNNVYQELSSIHQTQSYEFLDVIENLFRTMEYTVPEVYVNDLKEIEGFLKFYESVTMAPIVRPPISPTIQKLQTKVRDLRDETFSFIKKISISNILFNMTKSTHQVLNTFLQRFQTQFKINLSSENSRKNAIISLTNLATNLQNFSSNPNQTLPAFSQEVTMLSQTMGYSLPQTFINEILKCENVLQLYENVTLSPITYPTLTPFLTTVQNHVRDIKDKALLKNNTEFVPQLLENYNVKTEEAVNQLFTIYKLKFEIGFSTEDRLKGSLLKLNRVSQNLSSMQAQSYSFLEGIRTMFLTMDFKVPEVYVYEMC